MPLSTCKRILAPSLQILAMSLLHIIGELMLPLLVNLLSNDVYNVLQSCLSLRMRFLIVTMLIILFIVPPVTIKDKRLLLPLFVVFKDKRLLLPLFKVFKNGSDPLIEPLIEQCTHSAFTRPDDPLRNDPDVLGIRNMLHSCRDEMLHHSPVQMAQRVHTKEQVPDVEAALRSDYTTFRSRVLHRRVEIGPQTGNVDLDNLSLQIAKAMRRARQIDENCTLQFGCFALLKYKDGELKWWRLQEHWTPIIDEITCLPLNILDFFTGHTSQWIIRGSNLEYATLEASTANEKEEITILSRRKVDNGEDVLLCAEPGLIWRSALLFWRGVYICALNSINDTKEGLDFDLQSESKNVTKLYWTSVVEGLRPCPRTLIFMIAKLLLLGICFSLGYISQGMIVFLILSYWWLAAEPGPPIGGLERIPTLGEDLSNNHSPTSLPSIDHFLEDISNNPSPTISTQVMPSQEEGNDIVSPPNYPLLKISVLGLTKKFPLPQEDALTKMDEKNPEKEEEDKNGSGFVVTTAVADTDYNFSVTVESPPAMVGYESNGKKEIAGKPGDSMPSLQMCVPFEDLSNPGNATSLLPEEDESMNSNLNNGEKQKEEGEALLRTLSKSEDFFNLRTSPPAVPDNESIEQTENSGKSDESVSGVAVTSAVADSEDNFRVRETQPTMAENELHGNPDSNVPPPRQIYSTHPKISSSTSTSGQQQQQVVDIHQHGGSPAGPSQQLRVTILGEEGALVGLVKLLSKDDNPDLQKYAAGALQSLASEEELAKLIVNEEGAVAGLVKLLLKDDNPDLQINAAAALKSLADSPLSMRLKVLGEEGALTGLVKLLFKDDNPDLQNNAVAALKSLADSPMRLKILGEEGALTGLVKLLFKDDNPDLQKYAAGALQNLASEEDLAKLKIVNEEGAVAGLVKLLSKNDNPDLQKFAGAALQNLANGPALSRQKVLGEKGALAGLRKLLSKKDNAHLQNFEEDNLPSPQIGVPFEGGEVPNPQTTSSTKMWTSNGSHSNENLVSNLRSKKKIWGDGHGLDTDGPEFQELVKDFKNVSFVRELNLVGQDLGDTVISALGKAMLEVPFICLTSLELGGNSLTDDGVRNIAKAIKKGHLPALESLGLFPFRRVNNRSRFIQREEAQWIRNLIKDEGVKILATAFASGHISSLKILTLEQNGINTEGANFLAHEIRRGHLPSLEVLNLSYNDVGDEGIEALALALAEKGNNLKVLDLETCNIFAEGTKALATAFMSSQFPELTELYLGHNHTSRRGNRDGPLSDEGLIELARVLQNGKLPKLQTLDLEDNGDNTSRRVARALRNAVRFNKSLVLTMEIKWPPFSQYEGSIRRALERNRRVARTLQHLKGEGDVLATYGKIFLCGHPEQGKTTLRKSLQRDADAFRTKFLKERRPRYEPRTRGIEVSHIVSKGERGEKIKLAIWELAGQSEYNVLHSTLLPNLAFADGQATTFVIVCDANYHGRHHGEPLLNYWMRFIASSSIKGDENGKRHVILVLNRFNEKPCVSEGLWKRYLAELRETFHDYLEVEELPFVIDARVATSVRPLKEHLIQHTRERLETKRVPKVCQFIQDTITEVVKTRGFPVVPWAGFSAMFQSVMSDEQKLKAAADYLHESGHLIIFWEGFEGSTHHKEGSTSEGAGPGRSLVVLDPDWFCRKVVGRLLLPDRETMLVDGESPLTRWVRPDGSLALRDVKDYFGDLLLDEQQVSDIVAMLLRLGICYRVGTDRVLIPALILEVNQNPTGSWGKSGMQVVRDQWVMGYCLKVQYKTTTLLPIAVFRRLQVELAQDPICAAPDSEYVAGKYNITFLTDGMAVLVELSAHEQDPNLEDRVDILVRPLVNREQDRIAEKRKELQVHVAQLILEKFVSLAETWSPGVEFIRLVVKPWSTGESIIGMEDRNVTLSVEEVKSRVQKSGPLAMTTWTVDGEQVMAIDLLSGGELRELEISVAENCDLVKRMSVELGFASSEPQDKPLSDNFDELHHESLGPEQRQFLESMKTPKCRPKKLTIDQFDKRMDELMKSFQDVRKDVEEVLIRQRKVLNKLQALERFSLDEISKSVPRFMYLTKGKDTSGIWMTLKDLVVDNATLHFLCEAHYNDYSLHEVEHQEGVEIKNLTRLAAKIEPWLMWSLKVAFVVGKIANQAVLPGLGQLISSLPSDQQHGPNVDTATGYWLSATLVAGAEGEAFRIKTGIDTSSLNKRSTPLRPVERNDGLRDILKELIGNMRPTQFQSKFKLKRVVLNKSSDIVWICNDCFDKYHSRGEVEQL